MRVSIEFINRSNIIFVLFLGFGVYCFGDYGKLHYCETDDCVKTGIEFDRAINWNVAAPCDDFYHYACGSRNEMLRRIFDTTETQELYLTQKFENYYEINTDIQELQSSDTPLVQSIKRWYQLCNDSTKMNEAGVKPIVSFLNTVPYDKSWWELENWAVFKGLPSTLFSVSEVKKDWDRYDKRGEIILDQPFTRSLRTKHFETSRNMLAKLKTAGLNPALANRLSDGITKEKEFFSKITVRRSRNGRRHPGRRSLIAISNWDELWNGNRRVPSSLTKNDWDNYFENYWKGSVIANGIVPLLKNGSFKVFMEDTLNVQTLGSAVEHFTDDNMKNILLWRMVIKLTHYAGQKIRDVLDLYPLQSCLTFAMQYELDKSNWYEIIPKSVREPIQKMYTNIDLQVKLLNYKEMTKISLEKEPLTPREDRHLRNLISKMRNSEWTVKKVENELRFTKEELKMMEDYRNPMPCIGGEYSADICDEAYDIYLMYQAEIPKLRERIKILTPELPAKRREHDRCKTRYHKFLAETKGRNPRGIKHENTTIWLQKYIKDRRYPKFPFVDTLTRPKLIIQTPAADADYVQLGLSLEKWERAMLLQAPVEFDFNTEDEKFIINGLTNDLFARFKKNRPSSLNYGALGSALGREISFGFRTPLMIDQKRVGYLDYYINKNLLMRNTLKDSDWRYQLPSFIKSNIYAVYNSVDMPALLSAFDQFLKENPVGTKDRNLNVTEWLSIGYEKARETPNTRIGLKAAWAARQRDIRLNGEKDERLADVGQKHILSRFNQNMLFFHSFAYSHCEAENLTFGKIAINEILKNYSKFNDVYRKDSKCIAPL